MGKTLRRSSNIYKVTGDWIEYFREGDYDGFLGTRNRSDKRQRISRGVAVDYDCGAYYEDRDKVILLVGGND